MWDKVLTPHSLLAEYEQKEKIPRDTTHPQTHNLRTWSIVPNYLFAPNLISQIIAQTNFRQLRLLEELEYRVFVPRSSYQVLYVPRWNKMGVNWDRNLATYFLHTSLVQNQIILVVHSSLVSRPDRFVHTSRYMVNCQNLVPNDTQILFTHRGNSKWCRKNKTSQSVHVERTMFLWQLKY